MRKIIDMIFENLPFIIITIIILVLVIIRGVNGIFNR